MISIITPAYNCETWLRTTVKSIIAQTYTDWELLLINDGSRDKTLSIMEQLEEEDSRIRIFTTDHIGVAGIRNIGLDKARGDYIFFLDADDLLLPDTLQYLFDMIDNREEISVAAGSIKRFKDGKDRLSYINISFGSEKFRLLSPEEGVKESLYQKGLEASLCSKLFRRNLFDGVRFTHGELYEDLDIFFKLLLRTEKIAISKRKLYLYRQRNGSIIHTFNRKRLIVLEVTRRICDFMQQNYPELLPAALDRRFAANFNILQLILQNLSSLDFDAEEKIEETYYFVRSHALSELRNPTIRLKNRMGALLAILLPRTILFRLLKIL